MKIVRRRDGVIMVDGIATAITVEKDTAQGGWDAYDNGTWLFEGRSQWHVMNAITAFVTAFGAARNLLRRARDEMLDWQEALNGEREGLDELCAEMDAALGNPPKPPPWQQ